MKRTVVLLVMLLAVPAAGGEAASDIPAMLEASAQAWNRGDLDAFMADYLDSPEMTYTSSGKIVRGYAALRERYAKKYGSDRASMGRLRFGEIEVWELGDDHALALGRWYLGREGQEPLDGVFSLVLLETPEGWKILHDHSSLTEKK